MDNQKSNKKIYIRLFLTTIIIHWLIMLIAFGLLNSKKGFFETFYDTYTKCGDSVHYINIAENGYQSIGEFANEIVFYPLYPFLIWILNIIVHNSLISGVLISNFCLGISACYLYKLTHLELDKHKAIESVAFYILYPFNVFLGIVFTESLFIMLSLMCLVYIKERKWFWVGVTGLLTAITRSQGIVLLVPAVYEMIMDIKNSKKFNWQSLFILLIPLGTSLYLLLNKIVQGDWFAFIAHEEAEPWFNRAQWISANLTQQYGMALDYAFLSYIIYWVQIFLYFFIIALLFYGLKKKISTSIIAYGGAFVFLSYLHGWLISGPRYMMACVPMYVIMASIDNVYAKRILMVVFGILSILYTLGSWQGQAIM